MRRRTLRAIRRAGLLAPVLMSVVAQAQSPGPAMKDGRRPEAAPAAARLAPGVSDVAPADPLGEAFDLFTRTRTAPAAAVPEPPPRATEPPPAAISEIAPGVVAVERGVAIDAPPAGGSVERGAGAGAIEGSGSGVLGFAPSQRSAGEAAERLAAGSARAEKTDADFVARPIDVPLPRRRPADAPTAGEGELRLAALAPAPLAAPAPAPAHVAAETEVFGEPKRIPKAAEPYMALLRREAAANKVPLWLAVGVGWVESKYQPNLRGSHGVVGLMQVMPSTARFQGYRGPTERLFEPETNIIWGMKELGWDWAKSGGDPCLAIAKYKGGIATKRISPAAADYCRKAKAVTGMG
ncbi:MAG: transglycosylase SLT domain-containing protein [Siculibacillus sp.]|nr:transglycosylase SLT domain-containing protein [Siculibacillus sp.]